MFNLFGFSKSKAKRILALVDCKDGSIQETGTFPAIAGDSGKLKIEGRGELFEASISRENRVVLTPLQHERSFKLLVNGSDFKEPVEIGAVATLQVGEGLYYIITDEFQLERAKNMDVSRWLIFYAESGRIEDEVPFSRIKSAVLNRGLSGAGIAVCPRNFETGFMFSSVFGSEVANSQMAVPILPESSVATTCPLCWLKFDLGDAMSIASHESLRGDSILGPDEMMRFLPTSFNEDGVPLDDAGMPAPDIACPHCRKKLPPSYLELDQKIFSIVGAPSAGKSYYLSVLIRQLQNTLFRDFGITLKDLDPTGNMLLTQMKNRLFSAKNPEDAILAKTALEGAMYERYPRFGKMVALPKPFTYSLSKDGKASTSLIFYDNAGEHFEPGLDIEESPGAMHVASSAAIFFLFDPAANRNFKFALGDYPDPQLTIGGRIDQQDTILSEMEVRIKRILAIEPSKRIDTPMAVIIGKCDMWKHLLKDELKNPIVDGKLDLAIVDENSEILRRFMLSIDPAIAAGAQTISKNVRFFAVSALGHSPIMLEDGPSAGKIAPMPERINPIDVEVPTLWALSKITDLIPTKK